MDKTTIANYAGYCLKRGKNLEEQINKIFEELGLESYIENNALIIKGYIELDDLRKINVL